MDYTMDEAMDFPAVAVPKETVMEVLFGTFPDDSVMEMIISKGPDNIPHQTTYLHPAE